MARIIFRCGQSIGVGVMILLLVSCNYPENFDTKPTVAFGDVLDLGGYPLITREQIGDIPSGTHVKVRGILSDGSHRLFQIIAQDETIAEAREGQLAPAPDVTAVSTPTIAFIDAIGQSGYSLITLEQVGNIPSGTRVRPGGVWFDGINMMYQITTQDGVTAEACDYQLAIAPGVTLTTLGPTSTAVFESSANVAGFPLITLEQVGDIPAGTPVRWGSIRFDGTDIIYLVTAQNGSTAEAREDQLAMAPGYTPGPIPTAVFQGGYPLVTLEQVGNIPAGTSVKSGGSWYDGSSMTYEIFAADGTTARAREDQLAYAPGVTPGPTPTAVFNNFSELAGFPLITLERVGDIPAGTLVRSDGLWFDGIHTIHQVIAQSGLTAKAREDQLAIAPDYTPAPKPTPAFSGGYPLITLEQVGDISAGTRVRWSRALYDGIHVMYSIFTEDGTTAEARENQLAYAPTVTLGPTPDDCKFGSYLAMGYLLMTTEQVGDIPAGTRVLIASARRDDTGWIYFIRTQDGATAEARENQLTVAPYSTPGPSPTPDLVASP